MTDKTMMTASGAQLAPDMLALQLGWGNPENPAPQLTASVSNTLLSHRASYISGCG